MYPNCKTFYTYHFFSLMCVSLMLAKREEEEEDDDDDDDGGDDDDDEEKEGFLVMFSSYNCSLCDS